MLEYIIICLRRGLNGMNHSHGLAAAEDANAWFHKLMSTNSCDPSLFISHAHSCNLAPCWLTTRKVDFYLLFAMVFDECHTISKKKAQRKQRKSTLHDDSHKWNRIKWTKIKAFCSQIQRRAPPFVQRTYICNSFIISLFSRAAYSNLDQL